MDAVDSPYIRESTLETLILRADATVLSEIGGAQRTNEGSPARWRLAAN
jgi:hypothetical protein